MDGPASFAATMAQIRSRSASASRVVAGGAGRSAIVRGGHAVAMPQGFPYTRTYTFVPKLSSTLNALSLFSARLLLTPLHRVTFVLRRLIASVLQLLPRPVGDTLAWQAYHDAQRRAAPAGHPSQGGRA